MTDWAKLKVVDLRAELKRRDLSHAGLKAELVARLDASDDGSQNTDGAVNGGAQPDEEPADVPDARAEESIPAETDSPTDNIAALTDMNENKNTNGDHSVAPEQKPDAVETGPADSISLPAASHDDAAPVRTAVNQPIDEPSSVAELPVPSTVHESQLDDAQVAEPSVESAVDDMVVDTAPDSQKRKRRSASPPLEEEEAARKRARAEHPAKGDVAPATRLVDETDVPATQVDESTTDAQDRNEKSVTLDHSAPASEKRQETPAAESHEESLPMDQGPPTTPSIHPATCALYIKNLMRPLRPDDLRDYLVELALGDGGGANDDIIVDFHLDQVRTHSFVVLTSTAAASRIRSSLHDRVWPNESNRKALFVDFIPPEKVKEWVGMEEQGGRSSRGQRWEVVYHDAPDGTVETRLESGAASSSRAGPPPPSGRPPPTGPAYAPGNVNAIPVGPRGWTAPTGPRAIRPGTGPGPRPAPRLEGVVEQTRAQPVISYQTVSDDLARRRLQNMRSHYTRDVDRHLGREINRYSFENGDGFIDRGKEVFEGIRPPHRDRGGGFRGRGGRGGGGGYGGRPPPGPRRGGGPPPFRPRDDRYRGGGGNYFSGGPGRDRPFHQYDDGRDSYRGGDSPRDRDRDRDRRDNR